MQQIVGHVLSFDLTTFSFKSDDKKRGSDALKTLIFSGHLRWLSTELYNIVPLFANFETFARREANSLEPRSHPLSVEVNFQTTTLEWRLSCISCMSHEYLTFIYCFIRSFIMTIEGQTRKNLVMTKSKMTKAHLSVCPS